jgi:hypothetical protein
MDDFNFFTNQDRQDISYAACLGGTVLVGGAVGRFGGLYGLLGGAAVGLAIGLVTCHRLSPAIEQKLFSRTAALTEQELLQTLRVLREQTGAQSKSDAMYLLSYARHAMVAQGPSINKQANACMPARAAANQLLSHRA